jgi:flagellin-like hook-associated protein FlgL
MTISGIGTRSALTVQALVQMRAQLDDLQRQLGTSKKSDTYAGMGLERGLAVGLRSRLSAIEGYTSAIKNLDVRLTIAQSSLGRIADLTRTVKTAAFQSTEIETNGATVAQATAYASLDEMLGLLNTQVGDRYIYSGRAVDQPAVATTQQILEGDGARAGFKQIVAERRQADLGADGRGRLTISAPSTTSVQLAEETPATVFGFKLAGINSALSNATTTGPTGTPAAMSVDFSGLPVAGETIQFRLTLPDGTPEVVTLKATAATPPGPGEFTIGADAQTTAANLQTALGSAVEKLGNTALVAASAVVAADNFFNGTPQRVAGPPFASATALTAGTPADTVSWYVGEDGPDPARSTATAHVDTSISVSYGMRANEEGIRWAVQNVAALAAMTFSSSSADSTAQNAAIRARISVNLDVPFGTQKVEDIQAELAGTQNTLKSATERHRETKSALAGMVQDIEGVSPEEAATQIMALQTRLQASLQTTSMMYQISLVNYL